MDNIQLFQGDCLRVMKVIPDKSVDMVLCDPPYGITQNKWDNIISLEAMWEGYHRIVKDNGAIVLFCQQPFTSELIMSNKKEFKYVFTWYKHYCRNFLNAKKQPLRTTENIAVFYKKQCTYNPEMKIGKLRNKGNGTQKGNCYGDFKRLHVRNNQYYPTDILDFAGVPAIQQFHPTQKPVELLEYLIKTYTNEGDIVLDNCMGVGSTGIACTNISRRFIGIELDEEYFSIAKNRIYGEIKC